MKIAASIRTTKKDQLINLLGTKLGADIKSTCEKLGLAAAHDAGGVGLLSIKTAEGGVLPFAALAKIDHYTSQESETTEFIRV